MSQIFLKSDNQYIKDICSILKHGGVGVLPTDTIYGIVGNALDKKVVSKIYKLRKRDPLKPFIILISSIRDLQKFFINPDILTKQILAKIWPGKISVILPCPSKNFTYLHRGTKSLAFRLPQNKFLVSLLRRTGPLVAPSVNLEGKAPAKTIKESQKYFKDRLNFYLDAGKIDSLPSALVKIKNGKIIVLRKGAFKIK